MSKQQHKNFRMLKAFLKQLRGFGLNPYDWKIERSPEMLDAIHMYHRNDKDFRFNGKLSRTANGELYLRHLALASL